MEENSARWLAVREACRRILTEEGLILNIPHAHVASWHRLILNMADSMPQRLEFPEILMDRFLLSETAKIYLIFKRMFQAMKPLCGYRLMYKN